MLVAKIKASGGKTSLREMESEKAKKRDAGFFLFFFFSVLFLFGEGLRLEESVLGGSGEVDQG